MNATENGEMKFQSHYQSNPALGVTLIVPWGYFDSNPHSKIRHHRMSYGSLWSHTYVGDVSLTRDRFSVTS